MRIKVTLFILLFVSIFSLNAQKIKHVVLIGCDAFGAYAYHKADMPNLKKLADNGVWSDKARVVLPSSSAVNWASILMGASPTLHGYTEWGSKTPEISSVVVSQYGKFPSIYTILREQKPDSKTAVIYSWDGIGYLLEKEIINIDICTKGNEELTADTTAHIIRTEKPTFTFIHFDEPDHIGHSAGHDTPAYYAELKNVDRRIGKIMQAVKDAGIEKETVIMVVSDHGGIDKGHGKKSIREVVVPIVISGPTIRKGYELNSVIVDYDYAATIAKMFDLKIPQAWRGQAIMEIFEK